MALTDLKGAKKFDAGKPMIVSGALGRFPRALAAVARQSEIGCRKYDLDPNDVNFLLVPDGVRRYTDALGRHLSVDPHATKWYTETGGYLPPEGVEARHAAAVAWDALTRLEIALAAEENEGLTIPAPAPILVPHVDSEGVEHPVSVTHLMEY